MANNQAHPAQVANDLDALARSLDGTGNANLVRSLRRGSNTIRDLLKLKAELEAAAEEEHLAFERYRQGAEVCR